MVKQVIVMRKDLNMRRGKQISQGAHASMKVFFDRMGKFYTYVHQYGINNPPETMVSYSFNVTKEMEEWIEGAFTKVCVSVNSEQELLEVYNKAKQSGIPCAMITDSGKTEFNGVPTNTCVALGPDLSEKINKITGHLKLL